MSHIYSIENSIPYSTCPTYTIYVYLSLPSQKYHHTGAKKRVHILVAQSQAGLPLESITYYNYGVRSRTLHEINHTKSSSQVSFDKYHMNYVH